MAYANGLPSYIDEFGIGYIRAFTIPNNTEIELHARIVSEHVALYLIDAITDASIKIISDGPYRHRSPFAQSEYLRNLSNIFKNAR